MLAPSLMIQGTGSSVGKSFIVAGLCRLFANEGLKVAPYKSQNMSLNSAICVEETEISRAQAMQAQACRTPALANMNPVLLKPTTDKKAQVIINGKIAGNYTASQYHQMKLSLLPKAVESLNSLRQNFEAIVIEGAGSPAEINLMEEDIANMKIAKAANAPVILVGDIDKGGVFASLYGTYALLPEDERQLIKGFIINKFRGDKELLKSGISFIEKKTGVPVLGVLPFIDVELDAEDSAGDFLANTSGEVDIAVVKTPRMANFTDYWALRKEPCVGLRFVTEAKELKSADVIILPGSKSVVSDLQWMREKGIDKAILEAAATDTFIFGICGGLQMLSRKIVDEEGVESNITNTPALDLLQIDTVFQPKKITKETSAVISANSCFQSLNGMEITGYEVHSGLCFPADKTSFQSMEPINYSLGLIKNNIFGTFLHGIFNNDNFRQSFLNIIRGKKGLKPLTPTFNFEQFKDSQYEELAAVLKENLDFNNLPLPWRDRVGVRG